MVMEILWKLSSDMEFPNFYVICVSIVC